jgi:hypothetical protein
MIIFYVFYFVCYLQFEHRMTLSKKQLCVFTRDFLIVRQGTQDRPASEVYSIKCSLSDGELIVLS